MRSRRYVVQGLLLGCLALPAAGRASDTPVIEDVLGILRSRGLIDDQAYATLRAKNAAYEADEQAPWDRFSFSGDFRARHESFWYDRGADGETARDRYRLRYRLRLKGRAQVNDWLSAGFLLTSGENHNSATQTLGDSGRGGSQEFDAHGIFLRQAFLEARHENGDLESRVLFGKVPNPFRWSVGKDFLWDADIAPEGVAVRFLTERNDRTSLFANGGYFIIDEEGGGRDPHMFGIQLGGETALTDTFAWGGRGTFYNFRSLQDGFFAANTSDGNLVGGLGSKITVLETSLYGRYTGIDRWPLVLYGTYVRNLDARRVAGAGEEDQALGMGIEVGRASEIASLGLAYWKFEANAFPANFSDSVLFDGFTNRDGVALYGKKRVLPNTDLKFELFVADELESDPIFFSGLPAGAASRSDRVRLRTDIEVTF